MHNESHDVLAAVFMAAVAVFVAGGLLWDRLRRRRVARLLASRHPLDAEAFGRTYFGDSAATLRAVLSSNLKQRLDGLRPDDRLDEDLDAEPLSNPHLFLEIEQALGAVAPISDWAEYQQFVGQVRTFRDLVEYVALQHNASAETV